VKTIFAAVGMLMSVSAAADDVWNVRSREFRILYRNTTDAQVKLIFELNPGGCLIGPMQFFNPDTGVVQFKLESGVSYPSGCAKAR